MFLRSRLKLFDTPALVYDKGGGFKRSAHSAGPGKGAYEMDWGTERKEEGTRIRVDE